MSAIAALRRQLAETLAPVPVRGPGAPASVPTGLATLDRALGGGLPRGRVTEIVGAPGSGTTSLVRHLVAGALRQGLAVAYVDATRTLAPRDWAFHGRGGDDVAASARDSLWMVRPADPARGAWCADVLLRSGAFALVVLDGAPPLPRNVSVRLLGLAREADAAFAVLGEPARGATRLGGAARLRVAPAGRRGSTKRFAVTVEKGGTHQTVEVACAVGVARRLCAHPEVPDRRGAGRARTGVPIGGTGDAGAVAARAADGGGDGAGRPPGRKRRCAEPPTFVLPA